MNKKKYLTVQDLIDKLNTFDKDLPIGIAIDDSWQDPNSGTWWNEVRQIPLTSEDLNFTTSYKKEDMIFIDLTL